MTSTEDISLYNIDASTPMLGFTGPIGSGCTYISEMISNIGQPQKKYKYYKVSDVIRDILKSKGNTNPTVQQLQDKGNELRKQSGKGYLVAELFKLIDSRWDLNNDYGIIIDGIKNEEEVLTLRRFPSFYLFSIHADREVRCERVTSNNTFLSDSDFLEADKRDELEEAEYGQQVKRCNYLSDVIVLNNRNIPRAASRQKKDFVRSVYEKYVRLIENVYEDVPTSEIFPDIDELVMTIAYALSKSSSCLKRKVGAVIIDIDKARVRAERVDVTLPRN